MGGLRVQLEQVTMFLIRGDTLITLFQVSGKSVVAPISERLTHRFSIVRKNNDASFLLQSVMDGIVDHAIPITDAFRQEINELEAHVLALPRMKFTKELHQMSAQLSMLKRTLAPTQSLVHALQGNDQRSPLTKLSKTYMGDVMDHCNTMVEDIDSMLSLCEKLINMIFNIIAYDTNESMRRLALVSIIFLPITFLAGVYGTNFTNFPELEHHISYFWIICAGVTAVVLAAFVFEWFMDQRRANQVEKRYKRREPINASKTLLEDHYVSWVTEDTLVKLMNLGLNRVCVPIGFWAMGNLTSDEPNAAVISWKYSLRDIERTDKYSIRIMVELHAAPDSRNGWNHNGRSVQVKWMDDTMGDTNAQMKLLYLQHMATFFSGPDFNHVNPVMVMLNMPATYVLGAEKVIAWYKQAFAVVRQATAAGKGPLAIIRWIS
ncbi:hypothetical protein BGX27_010095 [Mortierella sp. AM989]|nr:hypothetical protein BGX27_010095 [Mortierella sp. AM989]